MKFLPETNDKSGKSNKNAQISEEKKVEPTNVYYNILNPSNKIQCDTCKRDVSKCTKILADDCDYCVSCFSNLEEYPDHYNVINKLDYPLFDVEWTADEELMLFQGLEKHGFGNWSEIAEIIGNNRTREDVEEHYQSIFIEAPDFIPNIPIISKRDPSGKLILKTIKPQYEKKKSIKPANPKTAANNHQFQRGSLTVNHQLNSGLKSGTNPAEIVGYMPKRGDFQVEYDNDAELLLAEMEFNDDDSEEEKKMKFRLIDIYNHKLSERIRRKQFVISRKLLDLKEQLRLDKTRTKQQKEIYNMMKVFARFSTPQQHQKLVNGIIKEKQIRQRIQELKELKKKGFRTLAQLQDELQNKKRKEQKSKKRDSQIVSNEKNKTRRSRKDNNVQKNEKRIIYLTREEEELCQRLNLTFKQYMMIKETIIRESVKQGIIQKDEVTKGFKIQRNIVEGVFDFLVEKEDIIAKENQGSD